MPFKDSEEGQTHFDPKAELKAKFEEEFYPVDMGWLIMEPIEISLEVVKRDKKILVFIESEIQKAREPFLRANTNKFIKEYQKDFDGLAGKETHSIPTIKEFVGPNNESTLKESWEAFRKTLVPGLLSSEEYWPFIESEIQKARNEGRKEIFGLEKDETILLTMGELDEIRQKAHEEILSTGTIRQKFAMENYHKVRQSLLSEVIGVLDGLKRGVNLGGMMEEQMNYAANKALSDAKERIMKL